MLTCLDRDIILDIAHALNEWRSWNSGRREPNILHGRYAERSDAIILAVNHKLDKQVIAKLTFAKKVAPLYWLCISGRLEFGWFKTKWRLWIGNFVHKPLAFVRFLNPRHHIHSVTGNKRYTFRRGVLRSNLIGFICL